MGAAAMVPGRWQLQSGMLGRSSQIQEVLRCKYLVGQPRKGKGTAGRQKVQRVPRPEGRGLRVLLLFRGKHGRLCPGRGSDFSLKLALSHTGTCSYTVRSGVSLALGSHGRFWAGEGQGQMYAFNKVSVFCS